MKKIVVLLLLLSCNYFAFAEAKTAQDSLQLASIDFKEAQVNIYVNDNSKIISGIVTYTLDALENTSEIYLDAKNLTRYDVKTNGKPASVTYDEKRLRIAHAFTKGTNYSISIDFSSAPSQALYHIDMDNDGYWDQIWTQGQGKYTSNWLPSIDDVNEKIIWDISVTAPSEYQVAANGKLRSKEPIDDVIKWDYDMSQPMSSYLVAIVVGNYKIKELATAGGTPLDLYYYPEDVQKVESTYQHTHDMFNFLEIEIGVPYPWQVYRQIPVKDFLYSGMENTTTTIFNDQFMVDEIQVNDVNYVTVNAHELAHQWFGDLVTATSSEHHWLQEGFATYYAMLAERQIYGNDHYYMQLYESAEQLVEQNKNGNSTALLNPKASSLTFYQRGAWALHALRNQVGEFRFRESVKQYLNTYKFQTASTDDFLNIVITISGQDLTDFKNTWLLAKEFPAAEALQLLRKSLFMEQYLQLSARRISSFDEAYQSYKETLREPLNIPLAEEMIAQLSLHRDERKYKLYKQAAETGNIKLRQAVALSLQELHPDLEPVLRSMLYDPSYLTRERALYLLWSAQPEERSKILKEVDEKWNSKNPNLDMAWIAMALNSFDFTTRDKYLYLQRLGSYTSPEYNPQIRLAAFDYLINLDAMSSQNYDDLMQGSLHHSWHFYKECRELLRALYKKEKHQEVISQLLKTKDEATADRLRAIMLR